MPSRFISRTTSSPNGVSPPCSGLSVAESAQERSRVGQRHVAGAEGVIIRSNAERVVDRVPALDADQRGDLAGLEARSMSSAVRASSNVVRVALDHAVDDVDLLERGAHGLLALLGRHVGRPELPADAARPQRGMSVCSVGCGRRMSNDGRDRGRVLLAKLPRPVVVPVDDEGGLVDRRDAVHHGRGGLSRQGGDCGGTNNEKNGRASKGHGHV